MKSILYNKLVRDNIPAIIESKGSIPHYRYLTKSEFKVALRKKLIEEATEYAENEDLEELADVVEVILALLETNNISIDELRDVRRHKEQNRGAFKLRLFLECVEER